MENLSCLNLVELTPGEIQNIEGGWWKTAVGVLISEFDSIVDGFNKGIGDAIKDF